MIWRFSLVALLFAFGWSTPAFAVVIGDRVTPIVGGADVYASPTTASTKLGTHQNGDIGTIVGGPATGNNLTWWQVNYDTGVDGWGTERRLLVVTPQTVPGKVTGLTFQLVTLADPVVLAWNANTEPDLASYKVYWGVASRLYQPATMLPLPHAPTATISNLTTGLTYYFAVTAYDASGNESGFSNEVTKTIP
jgi:hypothetical protein